ncbi:MAG: FKBP-type peptidyl-prolyl cis-trans isomerase [Phycisphaerales bacterium]|nr:FKBP-type peptidyl-prolyl cis-trans isomerase [Phycisphaerales bacterium]
MQKPVWALLVAMAGSVGLGAAAPAQPGADPSQPESATPARPAPGEAITIDDRATAIERDPKAGEAMKLLAGSRRGTSAEGGAEGGAEGDAGETALRYGAAPIVVDGLDNAIYFEVSREDDAANPFRQGVFHFYRNRGELRLRVFDLPQGMREAGVGMWIVPEHFPRMAASDLNPSLELDMTVEGPMPIWGATMCAVPVNRDGAVEMTCELGVDGGEQGRLRIAERGFNARGEQVWGTTPPDALKFANAEPVIRSRTTEDGLVVITLIAPAPGTPKHETGGAVVVHYTGWLTDGRQFDSTRMVGRDAQRMQIPAPIPIKGFNDGVAGIAVGERRRLVIPPALGFGDTGAPRGGIPANATLIFDVECLHVEAPPPQPPDLDAQGNPVAQPGSTTPPQPPAGETPRPAK